MQELPYNKITIKEICTKADLSRQTFYNFFTQKDDILHFYLQQRYENTLCKLESKKKLKISDMVESFSSFFLDNNNILHLMLDQNLDHIITDEISVSIPLFASRVLSKIEELDTCKYVNAFLTGALAKTMICWFNDPNRLSTEELSELLLQLFSGTYYKENVD